MSQPGEPIPPGEVDRFRMLVLPHLDAAYGFARFLCRDPTTAEDLVQDAYLRAFRGFPGFRGGDPKAWLLAIVRSSFLTLNRSRRAGVQASPQETAHAFDYSPSLEPGPEDVLVAAGEIGALTRAVQALPEPFRETLVLRELQEMSYRDIAEATGAPIGTVMSRLARARSLLAESLRPEGTPS